MLSINGKKFLNLPEAVQWLLNNNALPFQCKANYVPDTVIAKSDIVNPSPAEIKVGSLVLFADSKVGTVSGVTDSGFMVGQDYTDIGAQLNQIVGIELDASQHLVFTMANGDTIDAGLVKELSGLSIDASQHLIATYNDGSATDLGAIFQGNVNIAGNFTADSIIENMTGYSFTKGTDARFDYEFVYAGIVKNGNKLTCVVAVNLTKLEEYNSNVIIGTFNFPNAVAARLYPTTIGVYDFLDVKKARLYSNFNASVEADSYSQKSGNSARYEIIASSMVVNTKYYLRYEVTFLLSDNLAA